LAPLGILVAGLAAAVWLGLDPRDLFTARAVSSIGAFLRAALRPTLIAEDGGHSLAPELFAALRTTAAFALAGISLSVGIGAVFGFFASSAWWEEEGAGGLRRSVGPAVTGVTRVVIAAMRSVHELLWAMLFLAAMGLAPATAVVAIAIPYGGTLAKVWSEMLDEAPREAARSLRAIGAGSGPAYLVGLLPRVLPDMASYGFYRLECALRSSAVLGFLGFPTLGYHVALTFRNLHYRETWTFLYALFALVAAVELWSAALRRRGGWA